MFNVSKKFLRDHYILLLISINIVLFLIVTIFIILRLSSGNSSSYIVQCRDCTNPTAINKFITGSIVDLISFIVFSFIVMLSSIAISLRTYNIQRQLAITVLSFGVLLQILSLIVSNYLLVLR